MPCPHNEISIVQRSQQQSAIAAAAYQSGEKLFCEYDQQVKHYPEKRGIVHNEILLTMRAMDEHEKWLPKSRKVYDLDENGERIKLPSGRWKSVVSRRISAT